MKIKPLILEEIQITHTNYYVDLHLESNITFIAGDSGTGKSAVFSFIEEYASEHKNLRCFNYLDHSKSYKKSIKQLKQKLIVIDNADLLLDDKMRQYIALDTENQYIIIGRNPGGLMLLKDEINELISENKDGITVFSLRKLFA